MDEDCNIILCAIYHINQLIINIRFHILQKLIRYNCYNQYPKPQNPTQPTKKMKARSHLMIRPKQQLQNQLLMNFRKKNRNQTQAIIVQQQQPFNNRYYTPNQNHNNANNSMFMQNNRSILDQFSKCPIREDQGLYSGEIFLNKFMYSKNRPVMPTSAKTTVSVQTQRYQDQLPNLRSAALFTKSNFTKEQPNTKTPPKVTDFYQKQQKSIIDVSGNLSNYKFPTSDQKNQGNNKFFSDSFLGAIQKQQKYSSQDSAEQLLKQLQQASKDSSVIEKPKNEVKQVSAPVKNEPVVKKIQLSRNRVKSQNQPSNNQKQTAKENNNFNINMNNKVQNIEQPEALSSEKLDKLLSKKSLIKNMILNKVVQNDYKSIENDRNDKDGNKEKSFEKNNNQKQIPSINKWNKPIKRSSNQERKSFQRPKENKSLDQIDPLDLLLPYQTSSSGLQAVIEEQNQSQMQQSVKNNKINVKQPPNKIKLSQSLKNSKPQVLAGNKVQLHEIALNKKQQSKQKRSQQFQKSSQSILKEISLGDLSLQDMSQIQKQSGNKRLPDTFKKISNKDLSDSLPDYQDSQILQKPVDDKISMHKYIVNDISNDIKNLRKKISEDASLILDQEENEDRLKVLKVNKQQNKNKVNSEKGSEGPDKKMTSMLDFFDEVHQKLDFNQISKDIIDLRDRIANDSQ